VKVADVMAREVRPVPPTPPVTEIESRLLAERINGVPVLDGSRSARILARHGVPRRPVADPSAADGPVM